MVLLCASQFKHLDVGLNVLHVELKGIFFFLFF